MKTVISISILIGIPILLGITGTIFLFRWLKKLSGKIIKSREIAVYDDEGNKYMIYVN
jgi:hypothetical protein